MKIGIISDTHDHHVNVLKAIDIFNEQKVSYVFHAGDMVSPFTGKAFAALKGVQFIAVFGNCDGEKLLLRNSIEDFGGQIHERSCTEEIEGRRIFMTHVPNTLDKVAGSGRFDLVIYGHTHSRDIRKVDKTLIVNPGEATDWITGKSSVVVLELGDMAVETIIL